MLLGVFELFREFCSPSDNEFWRNSGLWKGKLGVFGRNLLFCSLLPLFRICTLGTKREQKSGNSRKTPKWQKERAGKPKFSCPAGEQILKKPRKTPTTVSQGPFMFKIFLMPRALSHKKETANRPLSPHPLPLQGRGASGIMEKMHGQDPWIQELLNQRER